MTQAEVARSAGVDRPAISLYEVGRRQPKYERARRVARVVGCTPEELWDVYAQAPLPRLCRLRRRLTQAEAARLAGVPLSTIRTVDVGGRVTPSAARKIAFFYDIEIADFHPDLAELRDKREEQPA